MRGSCGRPSRGSRPAKRAEGDTCGDPLAHRDSDRDDHPSVAALVGGSLPPRRGTVARWRPGRADMDERDLLHCVTEMARGIGSQNWSGLAALYDPGYQGRRGLARYESDAEENARLRGETSAAG